MDSKNWPKIEIECGSCRATGLYRGFAEPPGVAVVCLNCKGTGAILYQLSPMEDIYANKFTGRKRRNDVQHVKRSAGSLLVLGVGPVGQSISYESFLAGNLP